MKPFDILDYCERNPDDLAPQIFDDKLMEATYNNLLAIRKYAIRNKYSKILPAINQMIDLREMELKGILNATFEQRARLAHALIEVNGFMTPLTLQQ